MNNYPIRHSSWPRNLKGGYKVTTLPLRRKRHDGVRCYGDHRGQQCYPYRFSMHPPTAQSRFMPERPEHCDCYERAITACPTHRQAVVAPSIS